MVRYKVELGHTAVESLGAHIYGRGNSSMACLTLGWFASYSSSCPAHHMAAYKCSACLRRPPIFRKKSAIDLIFPN